MLFGYFMKLMIYHQLEDKSTETTWLRYFRSIRFSLRIMYRLPQNYSFRRLRAIIGLLREYDLRLKGINNGSTEESELLRELVYKILH